MEQAGGSVVGPGMIEVSRGRAMGVLASCVVHASIVIAMPRGGRAIVRSTVQPVWLDLQVEPVAQAPVPSVEPEARELRPAVSPRRERAAQARPAGVLEALAPAVVAGPSDEVAGPSDEVAAPSGPRAATIDLSPLAAARTLGDFPVHDAGVSREELSHGAQADALAQQARGLRASKGRSVEGFVVDVVEDALYDVLRPWKLFTKTMIGSEYRYTGGGFDAAILPDGRVRFREKDGPNLAARATLSREYGPGSELPPGTTFELNLGDARAHWQRIRGKDPHAAERRLFLERTRALREHLAGRAREPGAPPAVP